MEEKSLLTCAFEGLPVFMLYTCKERMAFVHSVVWPGGTGRCHGSISHFTLFQVDVHITPGTHASEHAGMCVLFFGKCCSPGQSSVENKSQQSCQYLLERPVYQCRLLNIHMPVMSKNSL